MRIAESGTGSGAVDGAAAPRRERKRGGRRGRQSAAAASAARAMLKVNSGEPTVAGLPPIPPILPTVQPAQALNVHQFSGTSMLSGTFPPMSSLPALQASEQVAATEYDSFLNDLTFNSKDVINNLTKIAGENVPSFNAIAHVLEKRILLMPPPMKLPFLYLVDSICKNIGVVFVNRFRQGIGRCFICAYECATPAVRASMQRLLNTWVPVFGQSTVETIRFHVEQMNSSPQVPGMASQMLSNGTGVPQAAHTANLASPNPQGSGSSAQVSMPLKSSASPTLAHVPSGHSMQTQLTTVLSRIESLFGEASRKASTGIPHAPVELRNLSTLIVSQIQSATLSLVEREKLRDFLVKVNSWSSAHTRHVGMPAPSFGTRDSTDPRSRLSGDTVHGAVSARNPHGSFSMGSLPVSGSGLRSQPSLSGTKPIATDLGFERLKTGSHASIIRSLYSDLRFVSKSDGMRFKNQLDLRSHLDWLFVQNKRKRARARTTGGSGVSRCWSESTASFLGIKQGSAALGSFTKAQSLSGAGVSPDVAAPPGVHTVCVSDGLIAEASPPAMCAARGDDETCPTCCEGFQSSWNDDKQAWMLVDAVRAPNDGPPYHIGCFNLESPDMKLPQSDPDSGKIYPEREVELDVQSGSGASLFAEGSELIPNLIAVESKTGKDGDSGVNLKRALELRGDPSGEATTKAKKARVVPTPTVAGT